jgi:HEAT repeat protein
LNVRECRELLTKLVVNGNVDGDAQRRLEQASGRIEAPLLKALRDAEDPLLREVAATILGERRLVSTVPALIEALNDPSEYVRFDALVAIDKCMRVEPGTLSTVLNLTPRRRHVAASRVAAWWQIVAADF